MSEETWKVTHSPYKPDLDAAGGEAVNPPVQHVTVSPTESLPLHIPATDVPGFPRPLSQAEVEAAFWRVAKWVAGCNRAEIYVDSEEDDLVSLALADLAVIGRLLTKSTHPLVQTTSAKELSMPPEAVKRALEKSKRDAAETEGLTLAAQEWARRKTKLYRPHGVGGPYDGNWGPKRVPVYCPNQHRGIRSWAPEETGRWHGARMRATALDKPCPRCGGPVQKGSWGWARTDR